MPEEKMILQSDQETPAQHDQLERVQDNQEELVQKDKVEPVQNEQEQPAQPKRTLKNLVNTPLKRVMFGIQILSYVLIVGSPAIGGLVGKTLELKAGATAGVILGIFIAGEVLFYGSLAFLGKELLLLLKDKVSGMFKRKR